jgi:ubiquinone/menaquinone biosynthesis C-methylase UbiE
MDPLKFTTVAHRDHLYLNPFGPEKMEQMIGLLDLPPSARVFEAGCGKGELLVRLVERYGCSAVGVDVNPAFLDAAREKAHRRVPAADLEFLLCEARTFTAEPASFDLAIVIGATHAYGDYAATLIALGALVPAGGRILLGEGYWKQQPDPEFLAVLGASADELSSHEGTVARAVAMGFIPAYSAVSTVEELDRYEDLYHRTVEDYVAAHPEDPDAPAMAERIRRWRDAYLRWGRDTLGFGLYLFENTGSDAEAGRT